MLHENSGIKYFVALLNITTGRTFSAIFSQESSFWAVEITATFYSCGVFQSY